MDRFIIPPFTSPFKQFNATISSSFMTPANFELLITLHPPKFPAPNINGLNGNDYPLRRRFTKRSVFFLFRCKTKPFAIPSINKSVFPSKICSLAVSYVSTSCSLTEQIFEMTSISLETVCLDSTSQPINPALFH